MLAILMPSLLRDQPRPNPASQECFMKHNILTTPLDIPVSNLATESRMGAPRDELDFVGHLIQHCSGRMRRGPKNRQ